MKKIVSLVLSLIICIIQCIPANAIQSTSSYTGNFHNVDIDILSNSTKNYKASSLASKYDPRSSNSSLLTSIKNQEESNLCWTYSAVAVAEMNRIKNGSSDNSLDLSENQLGYTFYNRIDDPLGNTSKDKNIVDNWYDVGGDTYTLVNHLSGYSGMVKDDNTNYKNYKTSTNDYYTNNNTVLKNAIYLNNNDSSQIKQAILNYGSVTCGFEYSSIYLNQNGSYYYDDNYDDWVSGHSVTIIGWDDNYSKNNFNLKPSKNGAWICKNSWGENEELGDNGYIYISYETTIYEVVALEMMDASTYNHNYFYDGSAKASYITLNNNTEIIQAYTAKCGETNTKELLKAIQFQTYSTNTKYTIKIYRNILSYDQIGDGSFKNNSTLVNTTTGLCSNAGVNTISLNKAIELSKGEIFAISITLSSSNKNVYLGISCSTANEDVSDWAYFQEDTSANQSVLCYDNNYEDLNDSKMVARVKALTVDEEYNGKNIANTTVKNLKDGIDANPTFDLYDGDKKLELGVDYTVSFGDTTQAKRTAMTVKGIGDYSGEKIIPYTYYKDINGLNISYTVNQTYNAKSITPALNIKDGNYKLVKNKDYTVTYRDNTNPTKKATITIKGKGFYKGKITKYFTINKRAISKASISVSNVTYNGKSQKAKVVVKVGSKTLKNGTDYTLTYSKNKNIGVGKVTIKAKGTYVSGTVTKSFNIKPKKTTITKLSTIKGKLIVKYKKVSNITGYQIAYKLNSSKKWKYINVSSKNLCKTISKLKSKSKYNIKVRTYKTVGKTKIYSDYSSTITKKVN